MEEAPRKSATNKWTRVFTRDEIHELQIPAHDMGPDLIYDRSLRALPNLGRDSAGGVIFSPMLFKKQDLSQPLSQCEIPLSSLLGLGEVATRAKRRFMDAACEDAPLIPREPQVDREPEDQLKIELKRRYQRLKRPPKDLTSPTELYALREAIGRKTIKKHELLVSEMEEIVETSKRTKQTH